MNSRSLRALVGLTGVLAVVGLLAFGPGFADRTLADWNDRVAGSATIEVPEAYGKGYARAVAAKYSMSRPVGPSLRRGLEATRSPGQTPAYADVRFGDQDSVGGNFGLLLPVKVDGASCAVYASRVAVPCTNGQSAGSSVVFAAAAARGLLVKTTSGGIDLAKFGPSDVVSTSASCPVGGSPVAGGVNSVFGGVVLAGMGNTERLPFPSDPGPNNSRSTRQTRSGFGYDYDARLTWTKTSSTTRASSELRLHLTSTGQISNNERWELDMVLAYAECGIGIDAPARWAEVKPVVSGLSASMTEPQDGEPSVSSPADPLVDEGTAGEDRENEAGMDEAAPPSGADPTVPRSTPDGADIPTDAGAIIPEHEPAEDASPPVEASVPAVPEEPAPSGPTSPVSIGVATPFSLVAQDGTGLGTATVERVTRTAGCVGLRLTVSTSDGAGSLKGLRASDFREILADGGTAPVGSPSGECDAGASLPAVFDPASTCSGWVTFDVSADGTGLMLRPAGTAGWIIPLPVAATASSVGE
ncbi:hypothetical protein [Rhodococcus sp. NPDC047139]|uniref:hypothetical protein n=1 Tax=Rhodococcus sp. NPDC047139 TaxID=3155141 RepID=UPI0033E67520